MDDTLQSIFNELEKFFSPIVKSLEPERRPLGIYFFLEDARIIKGLSNLPNSITEIISNLENISEAIPKIKNGKFFSPQVTEGFTSIGQSLKNLDNLSPIHLETSKIDKVGKHLIDFLITRYTGYYQPKAYTFFILIGVIKEFQSENGSISKEFNLEPFFKLLRSPKEWIEDEFNWSRDNFNHEPLIRRIHLMLEQLSLLTYWFHQSIDVPGLDDKERLQLRIPLFFYNDDVRSESIEVGLVLRRKVRASNWDGLRLETYGTSQIKEYMHLGETWEVRFNSSVPSSELAAIEIFPDRITADTGTGKLHMSLYIGQHSSQSVRLLFGSSNGTRVEIGPVGMEVFASIQAKSDISLKVIFNGAKLTISPGDGDGFIQKLLPSSGFSLNFEPSIGLSNLDGITFNGSAGLEATLPVHKSIGPLNIKSIFFKVNIGVSDLPTLSVTTSFSAKLGPLQTSISGVGIGLDIAFKEGGNLGFMEIDGPEFTHPNIIGASLDTELISGGGFLSKRDDGYDGMLDLRMKTLEITGIAILTTKMPNGKDGFSLLVSINFTFFPAIQLSFGFTLAGVGGLIGINRTPKVEPLRERIASGAVNSIMFPEDPVENADRIISDLRVIFPPQEGHFVVAPFLRIGFGTPSIIELDLGVILEFPFSGRILLLGSLGIYLPFKDTAIVEIHIDIVGDFNFAEEYIRIEGRLRNSHVLSIKLTGGFAFMLDWGRQPAFLFSIGGYHPRYQKPTRFPDIPRLSAYIDLDGVVRFTCEYYQAITSNSFQIGFLALLKASAAGASLEGHYSFDALLKFNPFYFSVEQGMSVKIKYKGKTLAGIGLYFRLSGPSPWTAAGYAEISILLFTLKIKFHIKWGEERDQPKAYESLKALTKRVVDSLQEKSNWSANLPVGFEAGEALRSKEDFADKEMVLHPSGYLQVRQTALPFKFRIEKYGNSYVEEKPEFSIGEDIQIGGNPADAKYFTRIRENFARGQFEALSGADKLSTPDFELFEAGLSFGKGDAEAFDMGNMDEVIGVDSHDYEEILIEPETNLSQSLEFKWKHVLETRKNIMRRGGMGIKRLERKRSRFLFVDEAPKHEATEQYVMVNKNTQVPITSSENREVLVFETFSRAQQLLKSIPQVRGQTNEFMVLPEMILQKQ